MPSTVKTTNSPKRPRRCQKPTVAITPVADRRVVLACRLDRNADLLLSLNCHVAAERLSLRAQTLREAGASA
jgi:hypothetical protein